MRAPSPSSSPSSPSSSSPRAASSSSPTASSSFSASLDDVDVEEEQVAKHQLLQVDDDDDQDLAKFDPPAAMPRCLALCMHNAAEKAKFRYHSLMVPTDDETNDPNASINRSNLVFERRQLRDHAVSFFESSWVFLLVLGVATSVTAWSVDAAVLLVQHLLEQLTDLGNTWVPEYFLHALGRVSILLLGVAITALVCPQAAGSGIPQMRSILGGFSLPGVLDARALVVKALGLVLGLGSGLSIGKEGPFVHLSAIIARQLLRIPVFRRILQSKELTHHVLAAACAVGVTATFGTPIGGVLFSIEVTTTYYETSNYWRAFFASVVGVVVFRQLNSLLWHNTVSLFTTQFDPLPYQPYEMVWFLLLAAFCGWLAAMLVRTFRAVSTWKERWFSAPPRMDRSGSWTQQLMAPMTYAALVALAFSLVEFPIGNFMLLSQRQVIDDMFSANNLTENEHTHLNDKFGTTWTHNSLTGNLLGYLCVRFFSIAISATVLVPSGIVTPVFAFGSVLGRLFGEVIVLMGGGSELAGGYAVVGAAAFTAGITGTVSIAVIVFELTSQLSYMLPVLLCVLVGRAVTLWFSLDMYETMARQKRLPQWPELTQQEAYALKAGDIMGPRPTRVVAQRQTLKSLSDLVAQAPPNVVLFPVVESEQDDIYLGCVGREELETLVQDWERCLDNSTAKQPSSTLTKNQIQALSERSSESFQSIDLVQLDLLSLDATQGCQILKTTAASQVILLLSVNKCPQLFVTHRARLVGVIVAADLLARTRRFTL